MGTHPCDISIPTQATKPQPELRVQQCRGDRRGHGPSVAATATASLGLRACSGPIARPTGRAHLPAGCAGPGRILPCPRFSAQNQSSRHGPPSGGPDFQRPSNRAPATRVGVSKSLLGRCLCGFEASRTRRASTTSARRDRARPGVVSCSRFSSGATRNGEMRRQIGW